MRGGGVGPQVLLAACLGDATTWTNLVNKSPTPDVYFRPAYAAAYAAPDAIPLALVVTTSTRRFLLPLLLRTLAALPSPSSVQEHDAITPYGYGGVLPLDPGPFTGADAAELLHQLKSWCISSKVITLLVRLHPLLQQQGAFGAGVLPLSGGTLQYVGPTAAIDLLSWDNSLSAPSGMTKGRRTDLHHSRRHLTVQLTPCSSLHAAEMMQQFRLLYEHTMTRLDATPFYFFRNEYYISLVDRLSSDMAVAVAYYDGRPVSAAIFLADSHFGHYHLSGGTAEGRQHKAQTMLLVEGAQWMRQRGCRWFHLGGGRQPGDSLYYFKQSFGATIFDYSYLALIADKARYHQLVKLREIHTSLAPPANNFFPAYRRSDD